MNSFGITLIALPVVAAIAQPPIEIILVHASATELATRAQLKRLLAANDVRRWIFTRIIRIDDNAIPHSNPVLTIHSRHLRDDDLLLSTFVHEQLHWFVEQNQVVADAVIADLRPQYPSLPVGYPDDSDSADANYLHLVVCYLEYQADKILLGELRARAVMEFWAQDHYRSIYRAVLDRPEPIAVALKRHGLKVS